MKQTIGLILLFSFAIWTGCSGDNNVTSSTTTNKISTRSVNDTLQIAITASNYTTSSDVTLAISTDTVNLNMAVGTYGGGTGIFKLFQNDSILIYSDSLNSVHSFQKVLPFRPNKASVIITGYTGTSSLLLTKK